MMLDHVIAPLFVPASRPDRFKKAAASGADAVILDLEDSVSPAEKNMARAAVRSDFTDLPVMVRVNASNTPWHRDDMAAVTELDLAAIIVPKAELDDDLPSLTTPIIALIETALGLSQARNIAHLPSVSRLAFGSIDFCAEIGCAHTRDALLAARSELVLASRLAGLAPPIDGVTSSVDDADLIASDARYARDLGFDGKLAIHPRQIAAIRNGFRREPSEIEWARAVLASNEAVSAIDGRMIDEPVRKQALMILRQI